VCVCGCVYMYVCVYAVVVGCVYAFAMVCEIVVRLLVVFPHTDVLSLVLSLVLSVSVSLVLSVSVSLVILSQLEIEHSAGWFEEPKAGGWCIQPHRWPLSHLERNR
jgi:hypothetical protein